MRSFLLFLNWLALLAIAEKLDQIYSSMERLIN